MQSSAAGAASVPARHSRCNAPESSRKSSCSTPTRPPRKARRSTCSTAPPFAPIRRFSAGTYADCADADIICITAGLRRKPDESRLDLINRNVTLFLGILQSLKEAGLRKDAIVLVVSNPVDILTQLAVEQTGLPPPQVIGLGTALDTSRFCSLIASSLKLPPPRSAP